MEKRLFLALVITIVFFAGYNQFVVRYFPPQNTITPITNSINKETAIALPIASVSTTPVVTQIIEPVDDLKSLKQVDLDNYTITCSLLGGYIRDIKINEYNETLIFKNIGVTVSDSKELFDLQINSNKIIFIASNGTRKEFSFNDHVITLTITPQPSLPIVLFYNPISTNPLDERDQEVFYSQNNEMQRSPLKKVKPVTYNNVDFAGGRDRYFCLSLLKGKYDITWETQDKDRILSLVPTSSSISFYLGPQKNKNLQPLGLQGVMYYGFFHGIGVAIVKSLVFLQSITKSWGLSVILLALLIYIILFPFTAKSTNSMRKMQELQPEVEALKVKYKDNAQKLNKEMLELYKVNKINPIGGCLPLLLQFPIFIALYQVFMRLVELKGAHFLWIKDLSLPDHSIPLPGNIPMVGSYINILPLLIVAVGLIQQKYTTTTAGAPEQKTMMMFMMVFMGVIFWNFPSCLVLYWFIQNLATLIYQIRVYNAKKA